MKIADFFRKFSSKTYLVIAFTGVTTTPVIMLSLIQYSFLNSNIISLMEENHVSKVKSISGKFEEYININTKTVDYLAHQFKDKNNDYIKNHLISFSKSFPDYISFYYYDKNKIYKFKNNTLTSYNNNLLKRYYLEENTKSSDQPYIINKFETEDKSECIGIVSPIHDKQYKGFLLGCLDMNPIKKYIDNFLTNKESLLILDKSNNTFIYPHDVNHSISNDVLRQIKLQDNGIIQSYSVIRKNQTAISYTTISSLGWLVLYEHPIEDYRNEIIKVSLRMLLASLVSLAFALGMGLWIAYYQHRFAKNILSSIREVAKGNYKKKVKSELILLPHEFDQMIKEFNTMQEKIEQLDNFKSNLIDTVSHEFRTPLTSIKGFSSTLLRKDVTFDNEMQRKLLKIISTQSDRLSRMVEDLLVVPKLEGNVLKVNLQEVELEPILEHISDFFQDQAFDIKVNDNLWILVDQDRFEQVVLNLFENAKKYSNPKGTAIKVVAFKEDDYAHIIFSNGANHVESEKLESLFNKFVRLDDALTRTTGGTGLGLYITKSLVELMNGKIWLESKKEQFRVHVMLPIVENE